MHRLFAGILPFFPASAGGRASESFAEMEGRSNESAIWRLRFPECRVAEPTLPCRRRNRWPTPGLGQATDLAGGPHSPLQGPAGRGSGAIPLRFPLPNSPALHPWVLLKGNAMSLEHIGQGPGGRRGDLPAPRTGSNASRRLCPAGASHPAGTRRRLRSG
jgi:hypothetical protein